jgi:hypothetical protein
MRWETVEGGVKGREMICTYLHTRQSRAAAPPQPVLSSHAETVDLQVRRPPNSLVLDTWQRPKESATSQAY